MRPLAGKAFLRPLQKRSRCASFSLDLDARRAAARAAPSAMRPISSSTSLGAAVALAEQDRGGVEVVAGVHEALDGGGHRLVHHLEPGRDDAGGDDRRDRVAGLADVVEAGHDAARRLGVGSSLTVTSKITASMPSLPITAREQVEAGRVERLAAELDRLAGDGEAAHLEHVVQRQAVLQAVHAARVLGDVAADRAGDLAARVGRVVQAVAARRPR